MTHLHYKLFELQPVIDHHSENTSYTTVPPRTSTVSTSATNRDPLYKLFESITTAKTPQHRDEPEQRIVG